MTVGVFFFTQQGSPPPTGGKRLGRDVVDFPNDVFHHDVDFPNDFPNDVNDNSSELQ